MLPLLVFHTASNERHLVSSRYDPYQKSGDLKRTSTFEEAYKAYNKYLTSLGGNPEGHESDEKFKAYRYLADSNMRRIYDLYGIEAFAEVDANPKGPNISGVSVLYKKNEPLRTQVYLTIEEFYTGKKINFEFYRKEICQCENKGFNCDTCKGSTTHTVPFTFTIDVVPGTLADKVYTFKGACDTSPSAGGGDLEIQLKELPDVVYKRTMFNLLAKVYITKEESKGVWEKPISLPQNQRIVVSGKKLKPVTHTGKGFPIPGTEERGDLIVYPVLVSGSDDL
jgi:DnaJ-class molecular chaperone